MSVTLRSQISRKDCVLEWPVGKGFLFWGLPRTGKIFVHNVYIPGHRMLTTNNE